MPGFSIPTFVRQAVAAVKNVPRTTAARASLVRRVQRTIVQGVRETFPALTESAGSFQASSPTPILEPIRLGTRSHRPLSPHAQLMAASRNFRSGATKRPFVDIGGRPKRVSDVGLGSARKFSSGPGGSSVIHNNVPVVLRAFASLLSDEETDKSLPRPTRFSPYTSRRPRQRIVRSRKGRRAASGCSVSSVHSRVSLAEISHYFPFNHLVTAPHTTSFPPTADTLVTPGSTTILSLPLSPSLSALLSSTTDVSYAAAEIGVAVLSSLSMGVISLHEAYSMHYWDRIGPLLARLDDLGLTGQEAEVGRGVRSEIDYDENGRADVMRFIFQGRSEKDVMCLLDEWLVQEGGRVWWGLREITEVSEIFGMELTKVETKEMMEVWDEPCSIPNAPETLFEISDVDLIYPSLDISVLSRSSPPIALDTTSWASGQSTPTSIYTPISEDGFDSDFDLDLNTSSPISLSSPQSLTASLLSQLSQISSMDSQRWSVPPPSEDDLAVELAESVGIYSGDGGSEVWSGTGDEDEFEMGEFGETNEIDDLLLEGSQDYVDGNWAGVGQGFGIAQSW